MCGIDESVVFDTMDAITNAIADSCEPAIIPDISLKTIDGKTVIVVDIAPARQRPYYIKSLGIKEGTYIRVAGTTRKKETRKKFYRLIAKLFSKNYAGQIYKWCSERGLKLTGHLVSEGNMRYQTPSSGSCMASYEFFHIPGVDCLGRKITDSLTQLQVVSAGLQTGKKSILSESFGLCGHNVSFSELRKMYEWQMVRGVNLLCPHLQGYTLRGIRKRDYPPAMYYQQPWWKDYDIFVQAMSRIGMLISNGKPQCDTLLIHPQTTAWICYDGDECSGLAEYEKQFKDIICSLERKYVQFHLGDEILIERHGSIVKDRFIIGNMEYRRIVLPPHIDFLDTTKKLINEFVKNGGTVCSANEVEDNQITDNENITYLMRCFDDFNMHYFVNSTDEYQHAVINVTGNKLDIITGKEIALNNNYEFAPRDSVVVIEHKNSKQIPFSDKRFDSLNLDGKWSVVDYSNNAITLDYCECYFDNKLIGKKISVSEIQQMACKLKRPLEIRCIFNANINYIPKCLYLVCETPEIFKYKVNDKSVNFVDEGYFRDNSFRKTDISRYLKIGKNKIELECCFKQSDSTYDDVDKSYKYESIKNRLTYDMEVENIYLVGKFFVKTSGAFVKLDKDAVRYIGDFVIDKPLNSISLCNIEQQGFPFFFWRNTC